MDVVVCLVIVNRFALLIGHLTHVKTRTDGSLHSNTQNDMQTDMEDES